MNMFMFMRNSANILIVFVRARIRIAMRTYATGSVLSEWFVKVNILVVSAAHKISISC